MLKMVRTMLSLALVMMMLTTLIPAGMVVFAEGENDTTLSYLGYAFNGVTTQIPLAIDDRYSDRQENRYVVTLPYAVKTFTTANLPKVSATTTNVGANATVTDISVFPGSAKIAIIAADGTTTRNYYVRFKYQAGNINYDGTNGINANIYKKFDDYQLLNLPEMREVVLDEGNNWEKYNRLYTDDPTHKLTSPYVQEAQNVQRLPLSLQYFDAANKWYYWWFAAENTPTATSSEYFEGASWITANILDREHDQPGDWITFDIDRGATVWVVNSKTTASTTLTTANGWTYSTEHTMRYGGNGMMTVFGRNYYKHFDAGTVTIPKYGVYQDRAPVVYIMWDGPGTGDTSLASLTATVNGVDQVINIVPGQTNYRIMVSQGSTVSVSATPTDSQAELFITQVAAAPGNANVNVVSAQNTTNYTIEFSSMGTDSTLKTLLYEHPQLGKQQISLTQGVTEYNVTLPHDISSTVPQVAGETNHQHAVIESITQPQGVNGSASVVVKAEDGSTSTYTINFSVDANPPAVNHLPGNVTNVKTRHQSATVVRDIPVTSDKVYAVSGSHAVTPTWYSGVGYETTEARVAAAMSDDNPYWTADTSAWTYGDRDPLTPGDGKEANPYRIHTQYVMTNNTSSVLLGDNVTRILTLNGEKDVVVPISDYYSFNIDKAATIYVIGQGSGYDNQYTSNGWAKESGVQACRGAAEKVSLQVGEPPVSVYYMIPKGYSTYTTVYKKHYLAGANVDVPNTGIGANSGILLYVVWDECNTNVALSDVKVNGTTIQGFTPTKKTYDIVLPAGTTEVPNLTAIPSFDGANVEVIDPETLPGTATINIAAADGVATGSYTINYTVALEPGDINGDGEITIVDVVMAAEIAIGYPNYTVEQMARANVSSAVDSVVDISDVVLIIERIAVATGPVPLVVQ